MPVPIITISSASLHVVQGSHAPVSAICALPIEMIEKIIGFIGSVSNRKDIAALRNTCKMMSQIDIPNQFSECAHSFGDMALKNRSVRLIGRCTSLRMPEDLERLFLSWIRRRLPIEPLILHPEQEDTSYIDYVRSRGVGLEETNGTILIGRSNTTHSPFVNMVFHTAYSLFESALCEHPLYITDLQSFELRNALSCTLFRRYAGWTITRDNIPVSEWYWSAGQMQIDNEDFPSGASAPRLPIIKNMMADTHKGLHRGYPISFEIREKVQRVLLETCYSPQLVTAKDVGTTFNIAQLVVDYATEAKDRCRRCEIQEAMGLTARVKGDQDKRLRGTLSIYQLIDEYAGHSK